MFKSIICVVVVINLAGCDERCNNPGAMRCADNVIELCTTDGEWIEEDDCNDEVGFDLEPLEAVCCSFEDEYVCLVECE